MKKIIQLDSNSIVTIIAGEAWKLLPDGTQRPLLEGEQLSAGDRLELDDDTHIELTPVESISGSDADEVLTGGSEASITSIDSPLQDTNQSDDLALNGLKEPWTLELIPLQVIPTAGFTTESDNRSQNTEQRWLTPEERQYMDDRAVITIKEPITADNIINHEESLAFEISGFVYHVEAGQPVTLTLTDSQRHSFELNTIVSPDALNWKTPVEKLGAEGYGLIDGTVTIKAETVDLAGNYAEDISTFLLDTVTEVTIDLAPESDSCDDDQDNVTNDTTPLIQGTGESGASISLYDDGNIVAEGIKVNDSGQWSTRILNPLKDGVHNLTASATDIAGNKASSSLEVTIDTYTKVWVNDLDTFQQIQFEPKISGETGGVANGKVVNVDASDFSSLFTAKPVVHDNLWSTNLPPTPITPGTPYHVTAIVRDRACNLASDHVVTLGNPLPVTLTEKESLGSNVSIDPISDQETRLSIEPGFLSDLPDNLSIIHSGHIFPIHWQLDSPQELKAVYEINSDFKTALAFSVPETGNGLSELTLYTPLKHPAGAGNNTIEIDIPYQKSRYSPTFSRFHHSKAGVHITVEDDIPEAIDHETVDLKEGEERSWQDSGGKLFHEQDTGVDGGQLSHINRIALDTANEVHNGKLSGYNAFDGSYGKLYVKPDGTWTYQANIDLIHTQGASLEDTFTFALTDFDGDSSDAHITFAVADGPPLSFSGDSVSEMAIDQECDQPKPVPDNGQLLLIKGSDPVPPEMLKFDLTATSEQLKAALDKKNPNSHGIPLDLDNLHPDSAVQSLTLSTIDGSPVFKISLINISTTSEGNLAATLNVEQLNSFDVSGSEPASLPLTITASDHDINTVTHRVSLTIIDGGITLHDDYAEVIEGETITGNLLANDQLCMDAVEVTQVTVDDSVFLTRHINDQFTVSFLPSTAIDTPLGSLIVQTNGDYVFSAHDSLKNNPDPIQFRFDYSVKDSSGDTAKATAVIDILDGAAPSGGKNATLIITEANLSHPPYYPEYKTTGIYTLKADGSDPVAPGSLHFDFPDGALDNLITSTGLPVIFQRENHVLRGIVSPPGQPPVPVLDFKIASVSPVGKDLQVQIKSELFQPLDHINKITGSELITITDHEITLKLPYSFSDHDGTPALKEGTFTATIIDGSPPFLAHIATVRLEEVNFPVSRTGEMITSPSSDTIVPSSWQFSSAQPGLEKLYSNGHSLEYTVTGREIHIFEENVPDQEVLTIELTNEPSPEHITTLFYRVTLKQAMDQDKGTWPLKVLTEVQDYDGDITKRNLIVNVIDRDDNLSIDIALDDMGLIEPLYQGASVNEYSQISIDAGTDAVQEVYFLKPPTNAQDYAIENNGQQLKADGKPLKYFPGPDGSWEAWSMDSGIQHTKIFTLSPIPPDGSPIVIDPSTTGTTRLQVTWYHYLDHLTATGENKDLIPITLTIQAKDSDGTTVEDQFTLKLFDGALPVPGEIVNPPQVIDINWGEHNSSEGTIHFTAGSDRPIPTFDLDTIKASLSGIKSDDQPLEKFELINTPNAQLTISRQDGHPVLRFSIKNLKPDSATVLFEQLDNLDHPKEPGDQDDLIELCVPVLLEDSDKDIVTKSMDLIFRVIDTNPKANPDHFYNGYAIAEEGTLLDASPERNLLSYDELKADADPAHIHAVEYNNNIFPLGWSRSISVDTDIGELSLHFDGEWSLQALPHIDHSQGENITATLNAVIIDGDGDTDSAPFTITIADQQVRFENIKNGEGLEDPLEPIPFLFQLNLGDIDRHETISKLSIDVSDLQGGTLTLNGLPVTDNAGEVLIPPDSLEVKDVNGDRIYTSRNLGYIPAEDASDYTFADHQITLNLKAHITKTPGPNQDLSSPVVIHVKGIADPPIWPEQIPVVTGEEDQYIPLGNSIKAELKDKDGSEVLSYEITHLPDNMKLFCHGREISAGTTLTPEQFGQLVVQSDEHWSGKLEIMVDAIATEQGYFAVETVQSPATIVVNIQPVADPPTLVVMPAGADPDTVKITGNEDERIAIGSHIKAALVDTDGSESLFLKVTPLIKPGEDLGQLWVQQGSTWTEILPGSSNSFEATGPDIDHLYYQPGKNRSSANFDDVRLQINAISRESTQGGVAPAPGKEEALSPDRFIQISIKGVPDIPEVTPNDTWTVNPDNAYELIGHGKEDLRLPLVFDLHSTDIDGSESLNSVVALEDSRFRLEDNHGRQPPIAYVVNGKPLYQITPVDLISGKYLLKPPLDYAGEVLVPMKVLVTELDGAYAIFDYQLRAIFEPVVDTRDQSIEPIQGNEVELNRAGKFLSGGAPLALTGFTLGDSDGSESITDITGFNLPDGFQLMVNGALMANQCGSLAEHLGGLEVLKRTLAEGNIRIVPIHSDGTIDNDYPTPTSQSTDFSFTVEITDQQNGLTAKKEVTVSGHIDWRGEVDGEQPPATPLNPDENTQVTIDNPGPFTGNDFSLETLHLASTDKDGSEWIKDDKRPQYEIAVYDTAGNKVTGGWHLQTSGGQELIFDNDEWLIQSGGLDGVSVHFTEKGTYFIHTKVIVEDIGDEEARYARMQVIVEENTGGPSEPTTPENIVVCSEQVEGKEDYYFSIPDHCINLDQTHTSTEEETTFRITVADLHGWSLKGFTTVYWNNDGEVTEYITKPGDFGNLQFRPPRDFSGEDSITYHILKRNIDSDQTSKTDYKISFRVLPVVENSPDEPPEDSVYDLRAWTEPAAEADEWKDADHPELMHLQLRTTDIDGSETIERVVFKPPENIVISGNGLQPDNSVYRQVSETEAQFEQRIASFTFTPGPGLPAGTYPLPLEVEVLDTALGTGDTDRKVFTKSIDLIVKPVNHCATLTAPNQEGYEDSDISITGLIAALNDNDGSEVISVVLSGVPDGSVIKDSYGKPLPFNGNGKWQIPEHLMDNTGHIQPLSFRPVKDFSGVVELTLNSHSHEQSLSTVCSDEQAFQIMVQPVGDPITLDQIPKALTGDENIPIVFHLNAKTTDTYSDSHDHPEGLQVAFTILPGSATTLIPPEPEAIKPSLIIPGITPATFSPNASGGYTATIETADTTLPNLEFNPGDGHGTLLMSLAVRSVDKTDGLTTAYGPEVIMDSTISIAPKSDKPSLQIDRKNIITTVETPVPIFIQASVINPAVTVNNLVDTELYTLVQGLPGSASLVNHAGTSTGTPSTSPAGIALVNNELQDLYLKDRQTGSYTLDVEAISDVGDGDNQNSDVIPLNVVVVERSQNISGTPNNDIIVSDGTAPKISAGNGDDLIAGGSGENQILPGSGNNTVWGGEYSGSGDSQRDTFLFEAGDTGTTAIQDFEPGVDVIDLSKLLNLDDVWSSSDLAHRVTIDEMDGKARITALSEVITLDTIPLETLLPGGSAMDPAERLSSLFEQGQLIVSHQFGHEGKDTLYAPPAAELKGDGIVNAGAGDDHLYANNEGSELRGGPGNDILELSPSSHAIDTLYWLKEDAGSVATPAYDRILNFHDAEDVIDITDFLPAEASAQPYDYMELSANGSSTNLNIASATAHQWSNTIELSGVDWLQGSSSEDTLKYQLEQGYLITGFTI
ncbi:Ig-like domain-containing protein [Endozoicomonas elysicola]|uniref:Bacterial Ig-like domain-containing protein n=1 Tax=Endozoicomonas elysicola TaxID=305900 RepID=A0A081KET8_9GAMM|nr:Ig-like domain-containing protein [Endozoicomonas elysicola]KEI72664.1 hypothetical protein GV64_19760 [Endozoicomonas elysicola]